MMFPESADHLTALPRVSLNGNYQDTRIFPVLTSGAATAMWNGFRRVDAAELSSLHSLLLTKLRRRRAPPPPPAGEGRGGGSLRHRTPREKRHPPRLARH